MTELLAALKTNSIEEITEVLTRLEHSAQLLTAAMLNPKKDEASSEAG